MLKQRVDGLSQTDDRDDGAQRTWKDYAHIQVTQPIDERCVQAQRHQQRREAHAGCNDAECHAKPAEQVPAKVGRDVHRQNV